MSSSLQLQLSAAIAAGDPVAYYSALAQAEVAAGVALSYGIQALGVVRQDTFTGTLANVYMKNKLENSPLRGDLGLVGVADPNRPQLMQRLMEEDFEARGGLDAVAFNINLSGDAIRDYHVAVFEEIFQNTRAREAWTSYYLIENTGEAESWRDTSWTPPETPRHADGWLIH